VSYRDPCDFMASFGQALGVVCVGVGAFVLGVLAIAAALEWLLF